MTPHPPWYLDWTFWAFVVAALALLASQLPPLRDVLRPGRLRVDLPVRINIAQTIGSPNVGLYLSITNVGNQSVLVESMRLKLKLDGREVATLPAQTYSEKPTDVDNYYMFSPIQIPKRELWHANVRFFDVLATQKDLETRKAISTLKRDIQSQQIQALETDPHSLHDRRFVADQSNVDPLLKLFDRNFIWAVGKYEAELSIAVDPESSSATKPFAFTLYEWDPKQLRDQTDDYKYGAGVYFVKPDHWDIFVTTERRPQA